MTSPPATLMVAIITLATGSTAAVASETGPYSVGQFSRLAHKVTSGEVIITPPRNITISNLHYDGLGPDAYFVVGKGDGPNKDPKSYRKIPNEHGSLEKLSAYNGETIILQLPSNLTFDDLDWLSMYCIRHDHHFGQVRLTRRGASSSARSNHGFSNALLVLLATCLWNKIKI